MRGMSATRASPRTIMPSPVGQKRSLRKFFDWLTGCFAVSNPSGAPFLISVSPVLISIHTPGLYVDRSQVDRRYPGTLENLASTYHLQNCLLIKVCLE